LGKRPSCGARIILAASVPAGCAADSPLVERFDFGTEELWALIPKGDVVRDQAGPWLPGFPNMEADSTAVQLKGNGVRFGIKDPGPQSRCEFNHGDAITLEAGIKVGSLHAGQPACMMGKGRMLSPRSERASAGAASGHRVEHVLPVERLKEFVGQEVTMCGLIIEQRTHHQVTGEPLKFLTLCDCPGMVETELFAATYRSYGLATVRYPVLEISAKVEGYENGRGGAV
jgi:hypothetical protein